VILLDTNVCIAVINRRPASVLQRLRAADPRRSLSRVSTISIFELRFGVAKSARIEANAEALEIFLRSIAVLPFDEEDARIAGNIRAELERSGRPIRLSHRCAGFSSQLRAYHRQRERVFSSRRFALGKLDHLRSTIRITSAAHPDCRRGFLAAGSPAFCRCSASALSCLDRHSAGKSRRSTG
jgi:tRNA(fMet)-specific endonuclease VapC